MTPLDIKKTWEEASKRFYQPSPEDFESMYKRRKETALERLAARYNRFSILGMVMIVVSFCWLGSQMPFINRAVQIAVVVLMMIYFAVCTFIDNWFYRGIKDIDCYRMTVKEVIEKALYYRKKHIQSIMFLLPFAFIVVGSMAYALSSDRYILLGMGAGALVGFLIGIRQYREFMSEYKIISEE